MSRPSLSLCFIDIRPLRGLWVVGAFLLGLLTLPLPASAAADTAKPARAGASIYSVSCASCHTYGMRGAPKLTDKAAWAPRLAQPPGMLYTHVVKGLGWMPPRGTCSTCTDEEIKAAVDYMVSRLPKP